MKQGEESNALDDFSNKNSILADAAALCQDVVSILQFLCEKLHKTQAPNSPAKSTEPLLLEAIYTVLHNAPASIKDNPHFIGLVWQDLSPNLIALLGNPLNDSSIVSSQQKKSYQDEIGRGSGCTSVAPPVATAAAKSIYSISVELVRLVGSIKSLRPVLESVFHRMLLYPPAVHRHEALLAVAELLKTPEFLVNLAGPTIADEDNTHTSSSTSGGTGSSSSTSTKKRLYTDVALLKLIVDSIQECSHCDNSSVCITSVQLIADLLTSVELLVKGHGLDEGMVIEIHNQYKETDDYCEPEAEGSSGLPSYFGRTVHSMPLIPLPNLDATTATGANNTAATTAATTAEQPVCNGDATTNTTDGGSKLCGTGKRGSSTTADRIGNGESAADEEEIDVISEKATLLSIARAVSVDKAGGDESDRQGVHVQPTLSNGCDDESDDEAKERRAGGECDPAGDRDVLDDKRGDDDLEVKKSNSEVGDKETGEKSVAESSSDGSEQAASDPSVVDAGDATGSDPTVTQDLPTAKSDSGSSSESASRGKLASRKAAYDAAERRSAQLYISRLQELLPSLIQAYSVQDIDEQILQFASQLCDAHITDEADADISTTLNGDGIYLATMYTLLLNLKLVCSGYYTSEEKSLPISEERYLDEVLGSGLIVYLSPVWLSTVYHHVITVNLLEQAGLTHANVDVPLVQLLTDLDGLGSRQLGGQLMTAYCSDVVTEQTLVDGEIIKSKEAIEAGQKFARRMMLVCWDGILDVLSVLLNGSSSCGITSSLALLVGGMEETQRARQAVCTSLDGLQKAARLSCVLGLQDRCGAVFSQLAASCCVIDDFRLEDRKTSKLPAKPSVLPTAKPKLTKLHASHALSMDVVLSIGLEMGSHSADCWPHVFRCCAHLSELEHMYFSSGDNQSDLPRVVHHDVTMQQHEDDAFDMDMDELYTGSVHAVEPVAPSINVAELIKKSRSEAGWDSAMMGREVLSASQAAKVLCGLSQQVDRLFEDASQKMNMKSFVSFLRELCQSSSDQLSAYSHYSDVYGPGCSSIPANALHLYRLGDVMMKCVHSDRPMIHIMKAWSVVAPHLIHCACHWDHNISKKSVNIIHEVITALLTSHKEHPHYHFHEALCKPFESLVCLEMCDGDIQDQIVCSICELVEACANDIHSGWKPLFGALRAIKIEYTTQEEVNEARQRHIEAVLEVFDVFLNSDNIGVFAYAAVDCILCLLKYVKGPGEFELVGDSDSDSGSELTPTTLGEDLCVPALKYLQQCCALLSSMWDMPACPRFYGADSIYTSPIPKIVDPVIHGMDLNAFQKPFKDHHVPSNTSADRSSSSNATSSSSSSKTSKPVTTDSSKHAPAGLSVDSSNRGDKPSDTCDTSGSSTKAPPTLDINNKDNQDSKSTSSTDSGILPDADSTSMKNSSDSANSASDGTRNDNPSDDSSEDAGPLGYVGVPLDSLDKPTGVLKVWFLVLDGLATTATSCPKNFQPQTLEVMFELLRSAAKSPGAQFSLHCVNHLVLPMIQTWLRKGSNLSTFWDSNVANFRQCCGLCTDLVVEFIVQFAGNTAHHTAVNFMLQQLLDILTECVSQSHEALARLGCSCIRHCMMSTGQIASERVWTIMLQSLTRAIDFTLYSLKQLMTPFQEDSDNFYGDIGQVKIAVRKDCSGIECERLRQLAQQVFLLDSQRGTSSVIDYEVEEDRSYIFLIYPPNHQHSSNPNQIVTRVPFRSLVVGLLSHQLLIQLVGSLLLQGSSFMVKSERGMIPSTPLDTTSFSAPPTPTTPLQQQQSLLLHEQPLPGMLPYLSTRNVLTLLSCLETSYYVASQFDNRPGLKFLVQKVARADVATNLYKYSGLALTFLMHTLIVISSHMGDVCLDTTKKLLDDHSKKSNKTQTQGTEVKESVSGDTTTTVSPATGAVWEATHAIGYSDEYLTAMSTLTPVKQHPGLFIRRLKAWFDEICRVYVDLYLDKEGPSKADELSSNQLVFLLAPEEELPQMKRDKSISEMVAEKLKSSRRTLSRGDSSASQGGAQGIEGESVEGAVGEEVPMTIQPAQALDSQITSPLTPGETGGGTAPSGCATVTSPLSPVREGRDRQHSSSEDAKVYQVVTDKGIASMMSEYKKRKQQQTMPTFVKASRSKPVKKIHRPKSLDPIDQEIDQQQQQSIMKDGEAHLVSFIEMLVSILDVLHQLPDCYFQALQPTAFHCITQLICHCKDLRLRRSLAQWSHRIGCMYGITAPGDVQNKY